MLEHRDDTLWIRLQSAPIDAGAALAFLPAPAAGAVDVFVGTTRRWTGGDETVELTYEAYEPMALREMTRLARRAAGRWPVERCCLIHRLGTVPVAEASVFIGVATPHRADAFEACRWLIDTLKTEVPIWKREQYRDGRAEWVQGAVPPELPPP